jgi:hypothetical protein
MKPKPPTMSVKPLPPVLPNPKPGKPVKPGKPGRGKPEIDFGGKPKKGGFELTNPSKPANPRIPNPRMPKPEPIYRTQGMAKGGSASKGKK